MKIPITLLDRILLDAGLQVSVAVRRDFEEIRSRVEHEGMSFLTLTLPVLDDALLKGLSTGRITPSDFPGFRKNGRGGSLPALLSGFFIRVFNKDGCLKDDPCVASVDAIRQVTRLFKKIELPCSPARQKAGFERYLSNDKEVEGKTCNSRIYSAVARFLWYRLDSLAEELYCAPGRFGSGATADRVGLNGRHDIAEWPQRSVVSFPPDWHTTHNFEIRGDLRLIDVSEERPVRVVQVPKTLKGPRTISVEPSYMMLMQQSVAQHLMAWLEGPCFPYDSIRFTDQSHNRNRARIGSIDGLLSTIDLSDASDRVSNDLVKQTFASCPAFLDLIQDCRSLRAQLPDGEVVTLNKFASQGSALCFPIEAIVFYTLSITAMIEHRGLPISDCTIRRLSRELSVYGDDMIVPTDTADRVIETLEASGLKVNLEKSFTTGLFRESCGGDYLCGEDVTPVYVRTPFKDARSACRDTYVPACASLSNQLYVKGYWHASQFIRDHLRQVHRVVLSRSVSDLGGTCYFSFFQSDSFGWSKDLHCHLGRVHSARTRRRQDSFGEVSSFLLSTWNPTSVRAYSRTFEEGQRGRDGYEAARCARSYSKLPDRRHPDGLGLYGSRRYVHVPLDERGVELPGFGDLRPGVLHHVDDPSALRLRARQFAKTDERAPQAGRSVNFYDGTSIAPYSAYTKSRLVPLT